MSIVEINPIYSKIEKRLQEAKKILSYTKEYWRPREGGYGREQMTYKQSLINRNGEFLTGFAERLGKEMKIDVDYLDYSSDFDCYEPQLKEITFRDDQLRQINLALKKTRGVLLAPTGAGKTILICGLISCFPNSRILFLAHTIDLVNQALEEFKRFGFGTLSKIGDGEKDVSGRIVVSSIQSFSKLDPKDYCDLFDVVFVDEGHHVTGFPDKKRPNGGSYYKVLSSLLAPFRFAVTATLSSNEEDRLCLEGLIGGVIDELTFQEATDLNILAVPKIRLVKVEPYSNYEVYKYPDIYDCAVVDNHARNKLIIEEIKKLNQEGLSSVTYVQRTEHILNLMKVAKRMGVDLIPVQGATAGNERLAIKENLHDKTIMNVVATVVWREGINIRSLNAIVIAGGGKDEKDLIQVCGRGARLDEDKDEFIIVDFIDSAKFLSQHFCERLGVYVRKGWL